MDVTPCPTIRWIGGADGYLALLDQTKLPGEEVEIACASVDDVSEAIRSLRVRGAPAIGVAAAYGVVLGWRDVEQNSPNGRQGALAAAENLATSRPTAVNLFWALDRMRGVLSSTSEKATRNQLGDLLLAEARSIHDEDREQCAKIGAVGMNHLASLPPNAGFLTHCNAGALATGGDGTALSIIFALAAAGKRPRVFADETRPLLQGARLTMWELQRRGIDATLICDSMAAAVMREGRIDAVITGADRVAANGDVANKIGTYGVALAAAAHDIPFYVAAPSNTFDLSITTGDSIPIETRSDDEITRFTGVAIAPQNATVYNPAFDITPARLVSAIICERGVVSPVNEARIRRLIGSDLPA